MSQVFMQVAIRLVLLAEKAISPGDIEETGKNLGGSGGDIRRY